MQSLQFLVAAADFQESVAASAATNDTSFNTLRAIVSKFIKDSSPFEVNIDSNTKRNIMSAANAAAFRELSQVGALCDNREETLALTTRRYRHIKIMSETQRFDYLSLHSNARCSPASAGTTEEHWNGLDPPCSCRAPPPRGGVSIIYVEL